MDYNIILEGCNCTGKSSIYEEIIHNGLLGEAMIGIQHKNRMPPKTYKEGKELNEMLLQESNDNKGIIFDRHILSEQIYAPLLRGYMPDYIGSLETRLKKHNILFLITADHKTVKKRYNNKHNIPIETILRILGAYDFHFLICNYPIKFIVDTSDITPYQALEMIEQLLKTLIENTDKKSKN